MKRHGLLVAGLLCIVGAAVAAQVADRPWNVIVFLVDDLGWTDAGCYGSDLYETPNVDRLAAEGVRFTDGYAACTVCSPTRAALMTGMYPGRTNVTDWIAGHKRPHAKLLPPDWTMQLEHRHTTIAEAMQAAGYKTAYFGKWHLTPPSDDPKVVRPYYPDQHGFDLNIAGNRYGAPGSYYWPWARKGAKGLATRTDAFPPASKHKDKYLTDMLGDECLGWLDRWADQPFFIGFAFYNVHIPIEGRRDLVDKYQKKLRTKMNRRHTNPSYAAMVEAVDENVGRIRAKLKERGVADRTLIIYISDNGGLDRNANPTDNHPLRAGKGSAYEGGVRVPYIVHWPGVTDGAVSHEPVITCDIYPTVLEVTGVRGESAHYANLDGVSLVPVLKEPEAKLDRHALYWHYPHYHTQGARPHSAVRARDWKLIHFYEDDHVELYNLADDISESNDLANQHPAKADELRKMLDAWRARVHAQPPRNNPNYKGL